MIAVLVVLAIVAGVGALAYLVSYNRLVTARQEVADAWAAIDVELERRHGLIPGLVAAVQQSAAHERRLLEELTTARMAAQAASHDAAARSTPEAELAAAAHAVVALREKYPSLDTQQNFLHLQRELATTEDRIGAARRFHNIRVAEFNRRVQAVPSNIVAGRHGFVEAPYFQP